MAQQFAAAPKVVKPKKKYKQKEPELDEQQEIKLIYNNLMWDKRIVRGNTYSAIVTSKNVEMPHTNTGLKQIRMNMRQDVDQTIDMPNRRANIQIFTDQYVETLTDKPPKYEYGAQTQWKIEKAIVRHQIQPKIGKDIETQIWDDQLFDFDYEVEPLLNVLCGSILQRARMQVLQEQELSIMRARQIQLHNQQQIENAKIKGMYQLEDRLEKQNAKRIEQFKKQKQEKKKMHRRLFSRVIAKQFLSHIKTNTLAIMENQGFFRNAIEENIVTSVLPHLYTKTVQLGAEQHQQYQQTYNLANQVRKMLMKQHAWAKQVERTRRQKITEKQQQRARQKNERKMMQQEQKYMRNFLVKQKEEQERLQAARKAAEEAGQNGQNEGKAEDS